MVLDTINENDELIFKNTHGKNKKYTFPATDPAAPDEFYFIHIEPINNKTSPSSSQSSTSSSDEEQSSVDNYDSEEDLFSKRKRQKRHA